METISLGLKRKGCERRIQALAPHSAFNVFVKANTVLSYKRYSIHRIERKGRHGDVERCFDGLGELLAISSRCSFFTLEKIFKETQTRQVDREKFVPLISFLGTVIEQLLYRARDECPDEKFRQLGYLLIEYLQHFIKKGFSANSLDGPRITKRASF
jgi:hypothetical protein